MKNKNKKGGLFLFGILLTAGFFGFGEIASAEITDVVINEILINGTNGEEFIELYNTGTDDIYLDTWYWTYYSSSRGWNNPYRKKQFPIGAKIKGHSFYTIITKSDDFSLTNDQWNLSYSSYQYSNSSGSIAIFPNNTFVEENCVDFISWGSVDSVGAGSEFEPPIAGKSWEKIEPDEEVWKESYTDNGTPGIENFSGDDTAPPPPPPVVYSDQILINEILPKPDSENISNNAEFVELYNQGGTPEKLDGWFLKDRVGKTCDLSGKTIGAEDFLILKNNSLEKCTLALNDTSGEFLGLYNPQDVEPVFSLSYSDSAKKGLSYNFNGTSWKWSKFLTPGEENIFNNLPIISAKKQNTIYVNVYAEFSATGTDADKDTLKYAWEFGDGHGSSLQKTRHKYEKAGNYVATLKVTDGSEDVLTTYNIEVVEFPKFKVKIVSILPNPGGKDTGKEYITLKNETKKKIDLKDWSIATGWKKLINHPIREKFEIKPGKTKKLTNKYASITLNNTQSKIELRNPAGKSIDKIKYKKKDGIPENALYEKVKKKWKWIIAPVENIVKNIITPTSEIIPENTAPAITASAEEIQANLGKYSEDPSWQKKKENGIILANYNSRIKIPEFQGRVLGASTIRENSSAYNFTSPAIPEEHWAVKFFNVAWTIFNISINKFLYSFS